MCCLKCDQQVSGDTIPFGIQKTSQLPPEVPEPREGPWREAGRPLKTSQDQPSGASQHSRYFQTEDASPHSRLATWGTDFHPNPKPATSHRGMFAEIPLAGPSVGRKSRGHPPSRALACRGLASPVPGLGGGTKLRIHFDVHLARTAKKTKGADPPIRGEHKI